MTHTNTEAVSELPDDLARYIRRATEMSEDGVYAWWSRLATLLTELQSRRSANSAGGVEVKALLDAYDAETSKIPLGHEDRGRGASSYNWRRSVVDDLRKLAAVFSAVEAEPMAWRWQWGMEGTWFCGTTKPGRVDLERIFAIDPLYTHPSSPVSAEVTVDELSQIIRRVDGNHSLGAGELAERILAALNGGRDNG